MYKFTRSGKHPGRTVILDRYVFEDGVLETTKALGEKYEPILCNYYGCTLEISAEADEVAAPAGDPSLAKNNTQTGAVTPPASDKK